jgi:hypothetical protein
MCCSSSAGGSVPCPFHTTMGTSHTSHAAIQQMSSSWYQGVKRAASHSSQSSTFGATTHAPYGLHHSSGGHGWPMAHAETARTRRRYVEEAGWNTTSGISVLAGTLVAFGAVTLVAAAAGAAGSALGLDTDGISTSEWRQAGIAGAVIGALVIFVSFFFGGYTAGRMSRRAGARHGLLVFLLSIVLMGAVAAIAWALGDPSAVNDTLQDNGVPTSADTWSNIGLGAAIAAGAAMLLGSILGGIRGDRWHGRLATAVVEHRETEAELAREEEYARTRSQAVVVDEPVVADDPVVVDEPVLVDRTETIDITQAEPSVEAEREQTRTTLG